MPHHARLKLQSGSIGECVELRLADLEHSETGYLAAVTVISTLALPASLVTPTVVRTGRGSFI